MAPATPSSVESWTLVTMQDALRNCLPTTGHAGPGKMSRTQYYPVPTGSNGGTGILEIVCRNEIAMAITYKVAKEHDTLKEGRATKRRRKDGLYDNKGTSLKHIEVMRAMHPRVQRNYIMEEKY